MSTDPETRRSAPVVLVAATFVAATGVGLVFTMWGAAGLYVLPGLPLHRAAEGGIGAILAFALLGAAVVAAVRYLFFDSVVGWGLALGAFLWVPFGNHILAAAPGLETLYPGLRRGLDASVAAVPAFTTVRDRVEGVMPPPETSHSAARPGTAAGAPTREADPFRPAPSRLPQIDN